MSAAYVRAAYPSASGYKRGDRLRVDGRLGTLVSFPDQYLGIRFDGEKHTSRCHPTWRVEPAAPTTPAPAVRSTPETDQEDSK